MNKTREFVISHWRLGKLHSSASMRNFWLIGRRASESRGNYERGEVKRLAEELREAQGQNPTDPDEKTPTDTVYRLANAYDLFAVLVKMDFKKARQYRRKYPYTRFDLVYRQWLEYEFDPSRLWDYLDYKGGNVALNLFIEDNENPSPEWERRAERVYRDAKKLTTDFGVPDKLHKLAVEYVKEFEAWKK